jgi:nucleoside 2-deoxyribosyltransferase
MARPRAYLAGPDVFLRDPVAFAEHKKAVCGKHGIEGVFPLDAVLDLAGLSLSEAALRISRANEDLIRSCQLVITNITPFRGPSCDVGTGYEMGFGRALGLPIFAYTNVAADFAQRTRAFTHVQPRPGGGFEDPDHMQVESFELADNLMLVGAIQDSGGMLAAHEAAGHDRYTSLIAFEACVKAASIALAAR